MSIGISKRRSKPGTSREIADTDPRIRSGKPSSPRAGTDGGPKHAKHPEFPSSYRK
jgi:hypothetical protein